MIRKLLFLLSLFLLCTWFAFAQTRQPNAQNYPTDAGPFRSGGHYLLPTSAVPMVQSASVSPSQPGGSTSYFYWIVTDNAGSYSIPSGPYSISTSSATLSATQYNTIQFSPLTGTYTYDLLRTNSSTPPSGVCNCAVSIGNVSGTLKDSSNSLSAYTVVAPAWPAGYPNMGDLASFGANGQIVDSGSGGSSVPASCTTGSGSSIDSRIDGVTTSLGHTGVPPTTNLPYTTAQTPSTVTDFAMIFEWDPGHGPLGGAMGWAPGSWSGLPSGGGNQVGIYQQLTNAATIAPYANTGLNGHPWVASFLTLFTTSGSVAFANSQGIWSTSSITSFSNTTPGTTTIGNTLVVVMGMNTQTTGAQSLTVSDSEGNVFKRFTLVYATDSGQAVEIDGWIATVTAHAIDTVTVSNMIPAGSPSQTLYVGELSGIAATGASSPGGKIAYYSTSSGQVSCDQYFTDAGTGYIQATNAGNINLQGGRIQIPICATSSTSNSFCQGSQDSLFHAYSNVDMIPQQIQTNGTAFTNSAVPNFANSSGSTGVAITTSGNNINWNLSGTGFGAAGGSHSVGVVPDPGNTSHAPAYYLGDDNAFHAPTFGIAVSQYSSKTLGGNVSLLATTLTTVDSLALTLPASGGPFRLNVCYNYGISNGTGVLGEMYVTDGTHNWAVSSLLTNSNGGIYSTCGWSPTTYANSATPTLTIKAENTGAQTIQTSSSLTGQASGFQVTAVPSN